MLTLLQSIELSTEYLQKKEIESPRLNAELLLADVLNCKRLELFLKFDQPLSENEKMEYRENLKRRAGKEPLQYIIGSTSFYGLDFIVNESVLIPRPETEILVETIINSHKKETVKKILDVGFGSGCIAITLAKYFPDAEIVGIDISEDALKIAVENAEKLDTGNVRFQIMDVFNSNAVEIFADVDIVVSNPPYVSKEEYTNLQDEITKYEPKMAVSDNGNGLQFYKKISELGKVNIKNGASIYFEIGAGQSNSVEDILQQNSFDEIKVVKDYANIERVISGVKNESFGSKSFLWKSYRR